MIKRYLILGGACSLALTASTALAQTETTINLDSWANTANYAAVAITGADTNSPTIVQGDANMAFAAVFPPMRMSEVEDVVEINFTLTVDGGIGSGNTRIGVYQSNGLMGSAAGNPPVWGSATGGLTGYLWALSSGGNAPSSSDGDAGTGTITAVVAEDDANWLSTYGGYSVVPDAWMGPAEASEAGVYTFSIELYRYSVDSIEVSISAKTADESWVYEDLFRLDDIERSGDITTDVPEEMTYVDFLGITDLNTEDGNAMTYEITNATVTGIPSDVVVGTTWLDFDVGADGWVSTGAWLGWVWVDKAPWVYSDALGHYIYVPEVSYSAGAGGWAYVPAPAAE